MIAKHLDLNLLMIFDAILAEGHVTRAAERLAMSQSAVSKGLAQLRQAFGDPLFLRASRGVVPTHRALEIADQVRQAIAALNNLASPVTEFDARSARAHFNIGATDYVSFVLLPGLMRRLQETAPHVSLTLHDMESMMPEEMLLAGKVDLVISSVTSVNFPIYRQELFRDHYVCLCRVGHPALADPVPIEQFVSGRHLAMPRQNGARERVLQDTLQRLGVTRDVAVQVPHMLAIPATLTATDLMATMAHRVAREFAARHPLQVLAHPLPLPDFPVSQLWHDRTRRSPSHQWLRDTVYDLARADACPDARDGAPG
ncbi:LysR family transcriptional regulator [Bordetella genomosp. 6]|uniref:LysR family transcriptional regulator n=1 Tax=Bordetella genomosp. 6 TaxID=463024 RepID=UPI000A295223|nr:LysR family transcriptional regulator [Bordetella genomosp. 6]ARP78958.1 LysR family transcriptional regulator [Bordetella genomosp. 6]